MINLDKKIIELKNLDSGQISLKELKVVFTNGCFDLLHPGHLHYLEKAKSLGDILIVGLNSDDSVSRLKGESRPINNQNYRATMLAGLMFIDYVIVFEEDTPLTLIKAIKPNVLVKGGDYAREEIVGFQETIMTGGEVEIIPFLDGYSTTQLIEKIQDL